MVKLEIDPKKFYLIGIGCFLIIGILNIYGLIVTFSEMDGYVIISRIAGIVFNFALVGMFLWLYQQLPPSIMEVASNEDIAEMLKIK